MDPTRPLRYETLCGNALRQLLPKLGKLVFSFSEKREPKRTFISAAAGVRPGSMKQPATVDATATGDRINGSDPQR
jgi:hypothetical protein